jgi:hypothetical protein
MNKINQILKTHWLTIVLSAGLLISIITIIYKNNEIKHFKYEISDLEDKVSDLEYKSET